MQFNHLAVSQLSELQKKQQVNIVDTRDPQSFAAAHIDGAFNLNQGNLESYLADCDMDLAIVVCCYHGLSSQGVAQFLVERGFDEVYSLQGGYEAVENFQKQQ